MFAVVRQRLPKRVKSGRDVLSFDALHRKRTTQAVRVNDHSALSRPRRPSQRRRSR